MKISFYLAKIVLLEMINSKWAYLLVGMVIFPIFFAYWNEDKLEVVIFSVVNLDLPSFNRELCLAYVFDDFFALYWLVVVFIFIPKLSFNRLINSFTISNLLYLKLSPVSPFQIKLYRTSIVFGTALFYSGISLVLAIIYCFVHNIPARGPLISIFGLFTHIIFSGGLLLIFQLPLNAELPDRRRWLYFFILFPVVVYIFCNQLIDNVNGFLPFTTPFVLRTKGFAVLKSLNLATFLGILFIFVHCIPERNVKGVNSPTKVSQ